MPTQGGLAGLQFYNFLRYATNLTTFYLNGGLRYTFDLTTLNLIACLRYVYLSAGLRYMSGLILRYLPLSGSQVHVAPHVLGRSEGICSLPGPKYTPYILVGSKPYT